MSDSTGHITAINSRTVTIPSSTATTSANGLMSSSDKSKLNGITESADSVSFSGSLTSGTKIGTITINGTGTSIYAPTNTDTHYTSKNVINSGEGIANTTESITNGNVYLKHIENGSETSSHLISGSGATSVITDNSGNVTVQTSLSSSGSGNAVTNVSINEDGGGITITKGNSFLPLSGGTLTGNLTGKYITGTWLQCTADNHFSSATTKIAVIDSQGWIYYRTPSEILSDIGAAQSYTYSDTDITAGTTSLETGKLYFVYE